MVSWAKGAEAILSSLKGEAKRLVVEARARGLIEILTMLEQLYFGRAKLLFYDLSGVFWARPWGPDEESLGNFLKSKIRIIEQLPELSTPNKNKTTNLILVWSLLLPKEFGGVMNGLKGNQETSWENAATMITDWYWSDVLTKQKEPGQGKGDQSRESTRWGKYPAQEHDNKNSKDPEFKCYKCNSPAHMVKDCPQNPEKKNQKGGGKNEKDPKGKGKTQKKGYK